MNAKSERLSSLRSSNPKCTCYSKPPRATTQGLAHQNPNSGSRIGLIYFVGGLTFQDDTYLLFYCLLIVSRYKGICQTHSVQTLRMCITTSCSLQEILWSKKSCDKIEHFIHNIIFLWTSNEKHEETSKHCHICICTCRLKFVYFIMYAPTFK